MNRPSLPVPSLLIRVVGPLLACAWAGIGLLVVDAVRTDSERLWPVALVMPAIATLTALLALSYWQKWEEVRGRRWWEQDQVQFRAWWGDGQEPSRSND